MQSSAARPVSPSMGFCVSLLLACCGAGPAMAQPTAGEPEVQTVVGARQALDQFFTNPRESLPATMLQRAEGVAIFPNMIKGGFILGVNYGRGVLHVRNPDRSWSPPVMVTMGGGSVGFQVGVQSADILLVFATPRSLNGVLQGQKVTLGADASVAAGPVGVQANAGTDAKLGAEIYSYARSRGLFMGVSLGGADLSVDHNADSVLYGRFGVTPADVFQNRGIGIRQEVQQLIDDLNGRSRQLAAAPAAAAVPAGLPAQPAAPLPVTLAQPAAFPIQTPSIQPLAPIQPPVPQAAPAPNVANPPLVPIQR
ncbi:MAG: lipid-binding SYLF domain-containing protein [Planctomycetia bacterium]